MTTYTDSKGLTQDAESMPWVKLNNAVEKMIRDGYARPGNDLEALKAIRDRRHQDYLAANPEAQA